MKKVNTFGIQFVIRKQKAVDGKAPIYVCITVNKKRCKISVKQKVSFENWNDVKG